MAMASSNQAHTTVNVPPRFPIDLSSKVLVEELEKWLDNEDTKNHSDYPNQKDEDGETLLHSLLQHELMGHCHMEKMISCLKLILFKDYEKKELNLNLECQGKTPLFYAIHNNFTECAKMLIGKGAALTKKSEDGNVDLTLATLLAHKMPAVLLDRFDTSIKMDERNGKICLNWQHILQYIEKDDGGKKYYERGKHQKETTFLCRILEDKNQENRKTLLEHPLVSAFLHLKYKRATSQIIFSFITAILFQVLYIIFLCSVYYMSCNPEGEQNNSTTIESAYTPHPYIVFKCQIGVGETIVVYILVLCAFVWLVKICMLVWQAGIVRYPKDWSTLITVLYFVMVAITLIPALVPNSEITFHYPTAAVGIFFAFVMLLRQFSTMPLNWCCCSSTLYMEFAKSCSLYLEILAMILWTVFKIYILFMPLLIAYYMGFALLLNRTDIFRYIMSTADTGSNISYEELNKHTEHTGRWYNLVTYTFCVSFVIIIVTVFVNFVLGASINNFRQLKEKVEISFIEKTIYEIFSIDILDELKWCRLSPKSNLVPLTNLKPGCVPFRMTYALTREKVPIEIWVKLIEKYKSRSHWDRVKATYMIAKKDQ